MHKSPAIILFIALLTLSTVSAQEIIYFDENWETTKKSDAVYYREYFNSNDLIDFSDYWITGEQYAEGKRTIGQYSKLFGPYKKYYKSGQLMLECTYESGKLIGLWRKYFENGSLQELRMYDENEYKVFTQYNAEGNATVENGNGTYHIFNEDGELEASGPVVDGLKNGKWTGTFMNGKSHYEEYYQHGELTKGESYDSLGNTYHYSEIWITTEPVQGYRSFYQLVSKYVRYPVEARQSGYQGKVYVEFIIDQAGSITNLKVVKDIGGGCGAAAIRAIKKIEKKLKWIAPKMRGQGAKQKIVLPITFQFG